MIGELIIKLLHARTNAHLLHLGTTSFAKHKALNDFYDEIVDLVRVFLPDGPNEARLIDQMETTINKAIELGFLHKLKTAGSATGPASYEVRRILKAFVDAQWLAEFDARLATYQSQLAGVSNTKEVDGHE